MLDSAICRRFDEVVFLKPPMSAQLCRLLAIKLRGVCNWRAVWVALTTLVDLTNWVRSGRLSNMSYPSVYAWQDGLSATEFQAALDAAKQDAERVRKGFVESLPPGSPAYDAEWTTRYGSKDRLIFVFSVVLDLDGEDFDIRDYPGEAADNATADLRRRIAGTKVGKWGVFVVTVTGRPRSSSDD